MAEQVAKAVAAHDAQNRKNQNTDLEERELQARIAANLKPAGEVAPVQAGVVPPAPNIPAVADGAQARRPKVMPDGTPLPELNREALLERALSNLVNKLDAIAAHPQFKEVWRTAAIQQVDFSDCPIWKPELDYAKTLIK